MPLFKVGSLALKTLSKPIANAIKRRAVEKPRFKSWCLSFAQWWHKLEVTLTVRLMGHEAKSIKSLSETQAVNLGADVLGEGVIFGIAASLLIIENRVSAARESAKQAKLEARFQAMQQRIEELEEAFASLRSDTLRLMELSGKAFTIGVLQQRKDEEKRRLGALTVLRAGINQTGSGIFDYLTDVVQSTGLFQTSVQTPSVETKDVQQESKDDKSTTAKKP